jgi:hypothetical protein
MNYEAVLLITSAATLEEKLRQDLSRESLIVFVALLRLRRTDLGNRFAQVFEEKRFADDKIDPFERVAGGLQHFGVSGDHHDRLLGRASFDGRSQFIAFHRGHRKIGDDEIELAFFEHGQSLFGVMSRFDDVSIEVKHHLDRIAHERLIINHQDVFSR